MPANVRRSAIQRGEGPTTTPVSTATVRRGHSDRSSTVALASSVTGWPPDGAGGSGSANGRPSRAARSRAIPAMHQASGRLPSTVMSKTVSACRPRASIRGVPGGALTSAPRTRSPAPSSERPSSFPEHNIPLETTPRILRRPISMPFGSTVSTGAKGTRSPTSKLNAPHTISTGPAPASTTIRRIRSAPLMPSISVTWLTTTSSSPSPTRVTPSTTRPRSSSAATRAGVSSGKVAKSRSQLSGASTGVFL